MLLDCQLRRTVILLFTDTAFIGCDFIWMASLWSWVHDVIVLVEVKLVLLSEWTMPEPRNLGPADH